MSIGRALALVTAVSLLGAANPANAGTCEDQLLGNRYRCTYSFEGSEDSLFFGCLDFSAGGTKDFVADLFDGSLVMACSCQATGSVKKTKFSQSKKFVCAGTGGFPLSMTGTASSKRMKKVQVLVSGAYQLMDCEIDPTCS